VRRTAAARWRELEESATDFELGEQRPFKLIDVSVIVPRGRKQ
jgi:hypothetical protein